MSLTEFIPRGEPLTPIISVGMNVDERMQEFPPLRLFVDGEDRGVIDCEISGDKKHGYIDAIDKQDELKVAKIDKLALTIIVECLRDYNHALETLEDAEGTNLLDLAA